MTEPGKKPQKIFLKDYQAPDFQVEKLELFFELNDDFCRVKAAMRLRKTNAKASDLLLTASDLFLNRCT